MNMRRNAGDPHPDPPPARERENEREREGGPPRSRSAARSPRLLAFLARPAGGAVPLRGRLPIAFAGLPLAAPEVAAQRFRQAFASLGILPALPVFRHILAPGAVDAPHPAATLPLTIITPPP